MTEEHLTYSMEPTGMDKALVVSRCQGGPPTLTEMRANPESTP